MTTHIDQPFLEPGWYIWNNTGDTATRRDSSGGTVDSCRYTGTSAGYVVWHGIHQTRPAAGEGGRGYRGL